MEKWGSDNSEGMQKMRKKKSPSLKNVAISDTAAPHRRNITASWLPCKLNNRHRIHLSAGAILLSVVSWIQICSMEMALMPRHLRGVWLVYTFLSILLPLSNAVRQQPLQTGIDAAPKRVAVIGKHSAYIQHLQLYI